MFSYLEIKIGNDFVKVEEIKLEKCIFVLCEWVDFRKFRKLEIKGVGMSRNYIFVDFNILLINYMFIRGVNFIEERLMNLL